MITVQIVGPCKLTDRSPIFITTVAGPSCSRSPPPWHSLYSGDSLEMLITSITNLTSGLGGPSQTGEDDSSSDLRASLDEFFLITNGVVIFCKYATTSSFYMYFPSNPTVWCIGYTAWWFKLFHEGLGSDDSTIPNLFSLLTVVGSNRILLRYLVNTPYPWKSLITNESTSGELRDTIGGLAIRNNIFITMEATIQSFSFPYEETLYLRAP